MTILLGIARCDLTDQNCTADRIGWSFLAIWTLGHRYLT